MYICNRSDHKRYTYYFSTIDHWTKKYGGEHLCGMFFFKPIGLKRSKQI